MCGLVGVFGQVGLKDEAAFEDLLVMDQVRGVDSTGVCFVPGRGDPTIVKSLGLPRKLMHMDEYRLGLRKLNIGLIGHNRAATKGKVAIKNAHPFQSGPIFGTHNGTLTGTWRLDKHDKFETDSECIFYNINKHGIERTWANLEGAAALVWYNHDEEELHFIRNFQRPLFFTITEDKKNIFWASETWMLSAALGRMARGIKHSGIMYPKPNYHFTFNIGVNSNIEEASEFLEAFKSPITPRKYDIDNFPQRSDFKDDTEWREALEVWREDNRKRQGRLKEKLRTKIESPNLPLVTVDDRGNITPPISPARTMKNGPIQGGGQGDKPQYTDISTNKVVDLKAGIATIKADRAKRRAAIRARNLAEKKGNGQHRPDGRPVSVKQFRKYYKMCTFCRESLADAYDTVTIIDQSNAACESCSTVATSENINMSAGV